MKYVAISSQHEMHIELLNIFTIKFQLKHSIRELSDIFPAIVLFDERIGRNDKCMFRGQNKAAENNVEIT